MPRPRARTPGSRRTSPLPPTPAHAPPPTPAHAPPPTAQTNADPHDPPHRTQILLRNRQRSCLLPLPPFRSLLRHLLEHHLNLHAYALGIHLVGDHEMTRLNESFLHHEGSTDVISFDHRTPPDGLQLHGELFICTDEARRQARRFRTSWSDETLRYAIHGVLHLLGHDDLDPASRRRMKRVENRLLSRLRHHRPGLIKAG